jgi:putative acetyltransferase
MRLATSLDHDAVHAVYLSAFADEENRAVATLAVQLLGETTSPETISLVAEVDGSVAGHIAFSPVSIEHDPEWQGYILAPLGVKPDQQGHGIGSALVLEGIRRLSDAGVNVVFVYGDPAYYGRFGFSAETAAGFCPQYELKYPFGWQAITLNAGAPVDLPATITCVEPLNHPELW